MDHRERVAASGQSPVEIHARLAGYLGATGLLGSVLVPDIQGAIVADMTDRPFGINDEVSIDFNSDGQVDFQIDHDRVNLDGTDLDYLQLDKNDASSATNPLAEQFGWTFPQVPHPDYTGNGLYDAPDYTKWRDNLGVSYDPTDDTQTALHREDGDKTGLIDGRDFDIWKAAYGADPNYDHAYMIAADCPTFNGCYPRALPAGTVVGPSVGSNQWDFSESLNAFGTGFALRANRLIDEDAGAIDDALGAGSTPAGDSPHFTGLAGAERFLGVRLDLNDDANPGNLFPTDNGSALNYWYGWIGVQITNEADATGLVTGFAYESTPGVGIMAGDIGAGAGGGANVPEPGSAILAVVGALVIVAGLLRRKRAVTRLLVGPR